MRQFYIEDQDEAGRCHRSLDERAAITIVGTTMEGEDLSFTGIVQSVDEDESRPRSRRWLVTMSDGSETSD
jgi:hypothetical protein